MAHNTKKLKAVRERSESGKNNVPIAVIDALESGKNFIDHNPISRGLDSMGDWWDKVYVDPESLPYPTDRPGDDKFNARSHKLMDDYPPLRAIANFDRSLAAGVGTFNNMTLGPINDYLEADRQGKTEREEQLTTKYGTAPRDAEGFVDWENMTREEMAAEQAKQHTREPYMYLSPEKMRKLQAAADEMRRRRKGKKDQLKRIQDRPYGLDEPVRPPYQPGAYQPEPRPEETYLQNLELNRLDPLAVKRMSNDRDRMAAEMQRINAALQEGEANRYLNSEN